MIMLYILLQHTDHKLVNFANFKALKHLWFFSSYFELSQIQ